MAATKRRAFGQIFKEKEPLTAQSMFDYLKAENIIKEVSERKRCSSTSSSPSPKRHRPCDNTRQGRV